VEIEQSAQGAAALDRRNGGLKPLTSGDYISVPVQLLARYSRARAACDYLLIKIGHRWEIVVAKVQDRLVKLYECRNPQAGSSWLWTTD